MRLLPIFGLVLSLAACGDPLAGVDRLGDVDVAETDPVAAVLPDATEVAREGFFGTSAAEGPVPENVKKQEGATPKAGGFFSGLIKRAAAVDPAAAIAADVSSAQSQPDAVAIKTETITGQASNAAAVELVALPAEDVAVREELKQRRGRTGLFGGSAKKDKPRSGPDARDVPFGTVLAFGEIARVCDAKGKSLGTKIDRLGRRGFSLHDSNPGIRNKRTFYIMGFDDKCPRQFTAANALFGAPSFYEMIRFSPAGKHLP